MIWVCQTHVKKGVESLRVPHVRETTFQTTCLFCKQKAVYELYYITYTNKSLA
ncbi:hypothetical protein ACJ2A9_03010 [Anaerobacillus sp. MEB173]|uniref:hypothetical protein n=1 Tax=Anaerobacillus sp. MEB173 TaxID=3383345 RepID=UPI003F91E34C